MFTGVYGNRTHRELCSNPPLVLKTRAATRRANTPRATQVIVQPRQRGRRRLSRGHGSSPLGTKVTLCRAKLPAVFAANDSGIGTCAKNQVALCLTKCYPALNHAHSSNPPKQVSTASENWAQRQCSYKH